MVNWIFDLDNTLTPSRSKMDPAFKQWFIEWQKTHDNYIVTGSDYPKVLEQLGPEVLKGCKMLFTCGANEVRVGGLITYASTWKPPQELIDALHLELKENEFPVRTGNHIELRTGMLNFSLVGRNADPQQRNTYIEYDDKNADRLTTALRLERQFDDIDFMIGGETGIDIYPTGKDKRQVLDFIKNNQPNQFFGDKTLPGGNDYPLAISVDITHRVENWEHTWEVLRLTQ